MQIKANAHLYYVSTINKIGGDQIGKCGVITINEIIQKQSISGMMLFTDELESIDAANRLKLLCSAQSALEGLSVEELAKIIPLIDSENISDTLNHMVSDADC